MTEENKENSKQVFDIEYVKKLREENASWRTKYREMEQKQGVLAEFQTRGIKADPRWVVLEEGKTVTECVDRLLEEFPNLKSDERSPDLQRKPSGGPTPKPDNSSNPFKNSNTPGDKPLGLLKERSVQELKKDPIARSQLRSEYRALLAASSNQKSDLEY
jgi:hypothetical protein